MDPRVTAQHSLLRRYEPPNIPAAPEPAPPPPPLTTVELRHKLNEEIEEHTAAADRLGRLEQAQQRAQQQCRTAREAEAEAEALLVEAKEDEPKSYVARLLANGDASDHVDDIVEAAQRRLAEAERKLKLARHGEEVIAEEIRKAQSELSIDTMRRDSAIKALVTSHKAVEHLRQSYAEALSRAAGLRAALSEVGRHLPPHTLENDADVVSDGVAFRNQRRIKTDGVVEAQWRD